MSFGRSPDGLLGPSRPDEPVRPGRAVIVPPDARFYITPPMLGMGPERLQEYFNPTQYDEIGNHWIDLDPNKRKKQ